MSELTTSPAQDPCAARAQRTCKRYNRGEVILSGVLTHPAALELAVNELFKTSI
jgi:hypothetical protein